MGTQQSQATLKDLRQVAEYTIEGVQDKGAVWLTFHARSAHGARVSLTVLSPESAQKEVLLGRFLRGARVLGELNHPNVVRTLGSGQSPEGFYYQALEHVEGSTLLQMVERGGGLEEKEAIAICYRIAQGMGMAEALGIVHRNIKPKNILIGNDGNPRLTGFGLARHQVEDSTVTMAGALLGTPLFTNPEQAAGVAVDFRSDIYSFGTTFFFALTGKPPFDGPNEAVIYARHRTEPTPLAHQVASHVSENTSRVIEKMMQKKPEDRYQTVADLCADLTNLYHGLEPNFGRDAVGWSLAETAATAPSAALSADVGLSHAEERFLAMCVELQYLSTVQTQQGREATLTSRNQGAAFYVWDTILEWKFLDQERVDYVRKAVMTELAQHLEKPKQLTSKAQIRAKRERTKASKTARETKDNSRAFLGVGTAIIVGALIGLLVTRNMFGAACGLQATSGLISLWAGIVLLIASFQESILWGLGSLLIPFVAPVFLFTRFQGNRRLIVVLMFSQLLILPVTGFVAYQHIYVEADKRTERPQKSTDERASGQTEKSKESQLTDILEKKRQQLEKYKKKGAGQTEITPKVPPVIPPPVPPSLPPAPPPALPPAPPP